MFLRCRQHGMHSSCRVPIGRLHPAFFLIVIRPGESHLPRIIASGLHAFTVYHFVSISVCVPR